MAGFKVITEAFEEWTEIFGSKRLTGALLDRITHHVHIMEMNGVALNASPQESLKKHETLCQSAYQANRRGSRSSISSELAPRRCPAFTDPSAPRNLIVETNSRQCSESSQLSQCHRQIGVNRNVPILH